MASVVWSCPQYRDPHLCQKQLSRDHVASDDVITAKDWVTGGNNHCFVCISPSQQPPVYGCFCNNVNRPKGLPAAMTLTFSEPLVAPTINMTGTYTVSAAYPAYTDVPANTPFPIECPPGRRTWAVQIEGFGISQPFTASTTYNWSLNIPGCSVTELVLKNPTQYVPPADKAEMVRAMNGNSCVWIAGDASLHWHYRNDTVLQGNKHTWRHGPAPAVPDGSVAIAYRSIAITSYTNWYAGVWYEDPPTSVTGDPRTPMLDIANRYTLGINFLDPIHPFTTWVGPSSNGGLRYTGPPQTSFGPSLGSSNWMWAGHMMKAPGYSQYPIEEEGQYHYTNTNEFQFVTIHTPAQKSEGSASIFGSGNPWDWILPYAGTGWSRELMNTHPQYKWMQKSVAYTLPDEVIGPYYRPPAPDLRVNAIPSVPTSRPYTSQTRFNSFIFGTPDETVNGFYRSFVYMHGYAFILSVIGRQFYLSMNLLLTNDYGIEKASTTPGAFGQSQFRFNSQGLIVQPWPLDELVSASPYEFYERFHTFSPGNKGVGSPSTPWITGSGTVPPQYQMRPLGRWESPVIPCNHTGVIRLERKNWTYMPAVPGKVMGGPEYIPQYAYLDIGDSGVQ